jgi:hypothetical protein
MTPAELAEFEKSFGGAWYSDRKGREAAAIEALLTEVEKKNVGDLLDQQLGLPTDDEQRGQLERQAVEVAKSSARASWVSAHTGWIGLVIAVVALIVAIIALVK